MTDCPALAAALDHKCCSGHRHISTLNAGGLAQFAKYPLHLCKAIASGLTRLRKIDARRSPAESGDIPVLAFTDPDEDHQIGGDIIAMHSILEDESAEDEHDAFDGVEGGKLLVAWSDQPASKRCSLCAIEKSTNIA